jgi:signal transduction histidine kinase/DNA-binding NarL/FixJ family response regulator
MTLSRIKIGEDFDFLAGAGEMGQLIREHDWSRHPLGKPDAWPRSLKTAVSLILNSQHPMWIGWGPEISFLYNDAYIHGVLGLAKHPWALGRPASEVWAEIWDVCGPLANKVFREGQASFVDDVRLFMQRGDHLEETYYSFSYSPIRDESGGVGGLFCPSNDTTPKVLGARRLRSLSELAGGAYAGRMTDAACAMVAAALAKNPDDVPFALLYLANPDGTQAVLKQTVGFENGGEFLSPRLVDLKAGGSSSVLWPLAEVFGKRTTKCIPVGRFDAFPRGPANQRVSEAMILPVVSRGDDKPLGVLIAGMNPTRKADLEYLTFFELVATQVGTVIQNARVSEDEKKRADMLEEIDRAKTAFFSNVSHEFRTPLTLMLGTLEDVLGRRNLPEDEREHLGVAHRNSLRLLKLVNSLLDFSRFEAGRAQATYQATDLAALTTELASNFRSACERAGLKLAVDCPPLPEPVYVDRGMWEKIVLNLLSNAFKFTFEGEIAVRLRAWDGEAELSVRDTGVGIPREEMPRLFERFHRIAAQQSRSYEGSGIGLALVQELVKLHGGVIGAESEPGRGTTFTIRIPFGTGHLPKDHIDANRGLASTSIRADAYVEEALHWLTDEPPLFDVTPAEAHASGDMPSLREGTRILIADDNGDMRDYVRRLLGRDCEVETAADGREAFAAMQARPPNLVITDVMMPKLDGFGLLRAIRSSPDLREIPVIMLSARAGEESRVEGLQAGADDYLAKPFSARELTARVSSLLELARVRRDAMTALRDSERRMRALFQQAPGFICILSGPNHVLEFANDSYRRLVGDRELVGKAVRDAFPDAEGQGYFELLDRCYRTGEPFRGLETPLQLRRAPGGPLVKMLIDFVYQPITDNTGEVTGIFVEGYDVTERVSAQAALGESEARYRTLFNSIDEGFCIIEEIPPETGKPGDYRYIAANPAVKEQSGIAVNVGEDTIRSLLSTEAQSWIDMFDEILRTGEAVRRERGLLSQGRVLDLFSFPLQDETKRRIGVIFTDVTERKRNETELRRANQDLEQFAYSASHDLQEPLRSVKIYSELLAQRYGDRLDEDAGAFLDFITSGASRMEMLIRDLLAYTQAGQLDRPAAPVDANEAFAKVVANLSGAISESGARVTSDSLPMIPVHATQLQQLFQNLIGNAVKYRRPDTPPIISVGVQRQGESWLFSVTDNGLGIEAEYKERIFGLFKRLHTGDEYAGTGIGLAICQRIVERYHGRIWVESESGKGSTFFFTLPV